MAAIGGVSTKYWKRIAETTLGMATYATAEITVRRTGSQTAFEWSVIHGRAWISPRRSIGRKEPRKAATMLGRWVGATGPDDRARDARPPAASGSAGSSSGSVD